MIVKTNEECIKVQKRTYKDHEFVDIRLFFKDSEGNWKPTKKGITFKPEMIDEIIEELEKLK